MPHTVSRRQNSVQNNVASHIPKTHKLQYRPTINTGPAGGGSVKIKKAFFTNNVCMQLTVSIYNTLQNEKTGCRWQGDGKMDNVFDRSARRLLYSPYFI